MSKVLQTEREDAFLHLGKRTDSPKKRCGILTVEYTRSAARQRSGQALCHIRGFPCPARSYNCVTYGFRLQQTPWQSEQGFAFCSFETVLRPSSRQGRHRSLDLAPTILASDAVQRLFDELFAIVTPRAAIVNLGQMDGRHVCVSVDRFVPFISSCFAARSFPCVLTRFYWIHNPAGLWASRGISIARSSEGRGRFTF
jgi:hypothetical protein